MAIVELTEEPLDLLTHSERETLARFLTALPGRPAPSLTLRQAIAQTRGTLGEHTTRRGFRVWSNLQRARAVALPAPPRPADWRVFALVVRERWKSAAVAAVDSPARAVLGGRTEGARRVQAQRAVRRVRAFLAACESHGCGWWARTIEHVMSDDPPDPAADRADDDARRERLRRHPHRGDV